MANTSVRRLFNDLRISDVIGVAPSAQVVLSKSASLDQAAGCLVSSKQSALAVVDDDSSSSDACGLLGIFTERDILRAYLEEVPRNQTMRQWFETRMARANVAVLPRLIVRPSDSLNAVAEQMVRNALDGDIACHHVVVQGTGKSTYTVVAVLDMVKALHNYVASTVDVEPLKEDEAKHNTVSSIMKSRDIVFICKPTDPVKQVLRIALLSNQNSVLMVDDSGIVGIITSRDLTMAYDRHILIKTPAADIASPLSARLLEYDDRIVDATTLMAQTGFNHFLVTRGMQNVVGSVSSFDLVLRSTALMSLLHREQMSAGPTVESVIKERIRLCTQVCDSWTNIGLAADMLLKSGRTALVVSLPGPTFGLLSEFDIMRAFVGGWDRGKKVSDWLHAQKLNCTHIIVRPTIRILVAASRMSGATIDTARRPRHHLVVENEDGQWLEVFSALDVVRDLLNLESELEKARTGADQATVGITMKRFFAKCYLEDTIIKAFCEMLKSGQTCCVVLDRSGGFCGMITPLQAVAAFASGISADTLVSDVVNFNADFARRVVAEDARLLDAGAILAAESWHHLVVMRPYSSEPVGVLSALDVVRGIASMTSEVPFVSLGWLAQTMGLDSCRLGGG